jgi:hypothetical protein
VRASSYNDPSYFHRNDDTSEIDSPTLFPRDRDIRESELQDIQQVEEYHGIYHEAVQLPLDQATRDAAKAAVFPGRHDFHAIFERHGYIALIDAIRTESDEAGSQLTMEKENPQLAPLEVWRKIGIQILASTPRDMLSALLDGSLAHKVETKSDANLAGYFDPGHSRRKLTPWAQRCQAAYAPSIYMLALVDAHGKPPEIEQLQLIIRTCRQYISGDRSHDQMVVEIDGQTRGHTDLDAIEAGMHHHLGRPARAQRIQTFIKAVTHNVNVQPNDRNSSLSVLKNPFKYFGVTTLPGRRAHQHSTQFSTNLLMAFVVDVCKYLFRRKDGTPEFNLKSYTVAHLASPAECRLAEELFTRMGGGYYYTGRGFNVANAGSMVCTMSDAQLGDCETTRHELGFIHDNIQHEHDVSRPVYLKHLKDCKEEEERQKAERMAKQKQRDEAVAQLEQHKKAEVPASFYRSELDKDRAKHRELVQDFSNTPFIEELKQVISECEEQTQEAVVGYEGKQAPIEGSPLSRGVPLPNLDT